MPNYEKIKLANGDVTELHYIGGGDGLAAIHVITTPNTQPPTANTFYTYTDHLGSILTLTDESANIVYEQNFDAWGRERNPNIWNYSANSGTKPEWLTRGYTGHEHLSEFGLINMNGRLYDPILARMLSPDNYVQDATSTQGYNRYSYVVNNPLKYTDPSGDLTWNDVIAGAAIVVGVAMIIASGGTASALAQVLIGSGLAHFGVTLEDHYNNGTSWDEASNNAGFQFSTTINTDWGFGKQRELKDWDMLPQPKTQPTSNTDNLLASNNGYLGTENDNIPTAQNGGFINDYNNFYNFMVYQANTNPVEVAAFEVIDKNNNTSFFVQPWELNDAKTSFSDFKNPSIKGYTVIGQYHTHPNSSGLSYDDANFSKFHKIPVYSIGANGNMWMYNHNTGYPVDYIIPRKLDWMPYGTKVR